MWLLIIYFDKQKSRELKQIEVNTIRDIAYLLNLKQTEISNFYHGLIYSRDILDYCYLFKIKEYRLKQN